MEEKSIPLIRFPEFSGEWTTKKLSDIGYFYYGKSAPKWSLSKDAKTPCVRYGELYSTFGEVVDKIHSYTNIDPENLKFSKGGEILVPRVGENPLDFANCSYLPFADVAIGEMISVFNTEENGLYLTYYINGCLKKGLAKMVEGGSVSNLYFRYLEPLKINIPSLSEQQKIASFLKDVDAKISKLTKKKELLEQYKKGVMQKIFSQELRFKDDNGDVFPVWKEKKLRDLGSTLNGLTGKTKEDFGVGKPYIQYKQIFDSSKIDIKNCGFVIITTSDNQTKMQFGDVFFTTSSESPNEIGMASVLLDEVEDMYLNSFCFGFRVLQSELYPSFSQFLFRSNSFRKKMIPLAQGSTRYNISKSSFLQLMVYLPSIEEQTKIANFLSDIDVKIEALNTNIENSKSFKKGLLQKMFV